MAARGEADSEVAGAAIALRERCVRVEHDLPIVVDVVGTGGDAAGTINISTMAALVVAAAGVPVAKHGNRAASSVCGSADVLEAAGLPLDVPPERCAQMLREANFAFLFAPNHHPAMKRVGGVRRELGIPTIFNLVGPLTNPASPTHLVVGVAREGTMEILASVLARLQMRGVVVHGSGGMDEVCGDGVSRVLEFGEEMRAWEIDPREYGVSASRKDVSARTLDECAQAFLAILGGERSGRSDVVALNAALALHACGVRSSVGEALELATGLQRAGEGLRVFQRAKKIARG